MPPASTSIQFAPSTSASHQEGLIDTQHGSGTSSPPRHRGARGGDDRGRCRSEAQQLGVDPREVAAALYASPARSSIGRHKRRASAGAACADQCTREGAGRNRSRRPQLVTRPLRSEGAPSLGPRLLDADGLAHVRLQQLERLGRLQLALDGQGTATGQPPAKARGDVADGRAKRAGRTRTTPRVAPANG